MGRWIRLNQQYIDTPGQVKLSKQVRKSDYPFILKIPPHGSKLELLKRYNEALKLFKETSKEDLDSLQIYTIVEDQPEFPGGIKAFYEKVSQNMIFPADARRMGIESWVGVQFVIDEQGDITEVECVRGIGYGCDEATIEAVEASGPWSPGMQGGKAVKVRMRVRIVFSLTGKPKIHLNPYQSTYDMIKDF